MKKLFYLVACIFIISCGEDKKCLTPKKRNFIFVVDSSDPLLKEEISKDIKTNVSVLSKAFELSPCEEIKVNITEIGGNVTLLSPVSKIENINTYAISPAKIKSINDGLSETFSNFITRSIDSIGKNVSTTNQSRLATNILKIINENSNDTTNLFIFSDFAENNEILNFYNPNFKNTEINDEFINKIFDKIELDKFKSNKPLDMKIYLIIKAEPHKKINHQEVRIFWNKVFKKLEIDFEIVDNLSSVKI